MYGVYYKKKEDEEGMNKWMQKKTIR